MYVSHPDNEVQINFSHNDGNYDQILWYRQSGRNLQLLGYMFAGTENLEKGEDVRIEGGANNGETCTLIIKDLSAKSSALYFCGSRYHSAAYLHSSIQKPPYYTVMFVISVASLCSCILTDHNLIRKGNGRFSLQNNGLNLPTASSYL